MLKAILTYSKKIPAETEYSSQGYSLSLETELADTDPAAIRQRLHDTFELVKSQVEDELANGKAAGGNVRDFPAPQTRKDEGDKGSQPKATNKQINYLASLASDAGVSISELNARVRDLYKADNLYELSKRDASRLVDDLKRLQKKAA